MVYIICIFIGIVTAFVGSLIGLGGGVILIPSLLFLNQLSDAFTWATPQTIVGISLVVMIFTALSSTISYFKEGRVDYKTGLLFLAGSIPGGVFGSWLNQFIDADDFSVYFGFLMVVLSMLFLLKRKSPLSNKELTSNHKALRTFHIGEETYHYTVSFSAAFALSLIVGVISGLFGIGGGSIMVPAMIILFGMPVHIATATSMFMILFISTISASTHIVLGHISWEYVFFFIPGAWMGGKLGAKTNQLLKGQTLEWILRILLVIIGLRLILEGFS
ncbi:sulfite exporter TauE/SafE family protein [Virgibacillus ndiopensis]|uniref:sulfite exporter TauE/SafE family protein n=1 Tax=Virgibacillus ndiopensis TaxID=2004408 RepID=UPI000C083FD4|nr:sulfite exporter TauE/SafE family protein [Virgibacillus ndiopensis]